MMRTGKESYTEEELKQIHQAEEKALNLLSYADRTEFLLREKLKEGEFPPFAVEEAVEYVKSYHYLDDLRYAENYLRSHMDRKSVYEMREALREKGVFSEIREQAFLNVEIDEVALVSSLFQKKYGTKDLKDPKVYEKARRYFAGKGFPYEAVKKGITAVLTESDSLS